MEYKLPVEREIEVTKPIRARAKKPDGSIEERLAALAILLGVASPEEDSLEGGIFDAARELRKQILSLDGSE